MGTRARRILAAAAVCLVAAPLPGARAEDLPSEARYALANGCYTVRPSAGGTEIAGGPFRFQATALASYLLYGPDRHFVAAGPGGSLTSAEQPSPAADWRVDVDGAAYTLTSAAGVAAGRFDLEPASGCAVYPEAELGATGTPFKGESPDAIVSGFVDAHVHLMTFEFLGGNAICGRPWHPYGIAYALPDCKDTEGPGGVAAPIQNFLEYSSPVHLKDTRGWPTFKDWPNPHSLAHQQDYYKWLERAWMGGLRMAVDTLTDNTQLCQLFVNRRNGCDEMESIRLQAHDSYAMQDYIDAQSGGPGKGWFRIVKDPVEARHVINDGKLAVLLGVETSRPLGCRVLLGQPQCDEAQIDRELDDLYDLGIRALFPVHKFDNAFGGTTGDDGALGLVVNTGNFSETGQFWSFEPCPDTEESGAHDKSQLSPFTGALTPLGSAVGPQLPVGVTPLYPDGPLCSTKGLTDLGRHLLDRMMAKGMLIEVDHMSVRTRDDTLALLQERHYPGVIASHCWSTPDAVQPVLALGGFVNTCGGPDWAAKVKAQANSGYYCGLGRSTDMGGFAGQEPPPASGTNLVQYPFTSFDGGVTFDRQVTGQRTFDFDTDGVSHYGLVPDSIEYARVNGGEELVANQFKGAESYLRTWSAATSATAAAAAVEAAAVEAAAGGSAAPFNGPAPALPRTGTSLGTGLAMGLALLGLALGLRELSRNSRQ